jgi:Flp pilus assembly protein TadG
MSVTALKWLKARIDRFAASTSGVAAIEFAYLAPLLMLMTWGTLEISRGVMTHKRFQRVTAMVGDLVAREKQLGTNVSEAKAELAGIMESAKNVMLPFSSTPLKLTVMSVRSNPNPPNATTVEWSYAYQGATAPQCPAPKVMPAGMISPGNAAIVVESSYVYTPLLANLSQAFGGWGSSITWTDTITNSPRNSCVDYAGMNCTGVCPPSN